jgi:hypothetical protein
MGFQKEKSESGLALKQGIGFLGVWSWYCILSEFCCPRLIHSEQLHARGPELGRRQGQGMARRGDANAMKPAWTGAERRCFITALGTPSSLARCCVSPCCLPAFEFFCDAKADTVWRRK